MEAIQRSNIKWNHAATSVPEALGLTNDEGKEIEKKVEEVAEEFSTQSEVIEGVVNAYGEEPAKQAYALYICTRAEMNVAMVGEAARAEAVAEAVGEE